MCETMANGISAIHDLKAQHKVDDYALSKPLCEVDPEIHAIIQKEKLRQKRGLEMIASENFTTRAVMECLGSCLTNKYSEGLPGVRYYGGNEFIDQIERLAQSRSLHAFGLDSNDWGINVQPYSGSPANFAVLAATIEPHGRLMGLDLPDGGHLTHGFQTPTKKISATSIFYEAMPYKSDQDGLIDYDRLEENAKLFKPNIIIAGISCYTRDLDYARFRKIADDNKALLMADMAHVSGLVAGGVAPDPFKYCDIVTTTVHKTLGGPRSGIIFFRKGVRSVTKTGEKVMYDLEKKINDMVFPGLQGGPHNHQIAGIAVIMKRAASPEFKLYAQQVIKNAQALAKLLQNYGYKLVTDGTDNHIVWVDLRPFGLNGSKSEFILEEVSIACNKNTVPGDKSALNPSGIRLGTSALTTRNFNEGDMDNVALYIHKALTIAKEAVALSGPKLVDYKRVLSSDEGISVKVAALRSEVEVFASAFPLPTGSDIQ